MQQMKQDQIIDEYPEDQSFDDSTENPFSWNDEKETRYVYVYDDDPEKPIWKKDQIIAAMIGVLALAMFVSLCLLPSGQSYAIQRVTVSAHFNTQEFKASAPIIPTGIQTDSATKATGTLAAYNGSIFTQQLPANFLLTASNGIEVATDYAVTIPAANERSNPPTFGVTLVAAHAINSGSNGNIQAGAINQAYGSDITIKNLAAFSGGQDASTKTFVTANDKTIALESARAQLTTQQPVGLHLPCAENVSQQPLSIVAIWFCQYATYQAPKGVQVLSVSLSGTSVVLIVRRGARSVTTHFAK